MRIRDACSCTLVFATALCVARPTIAQELPADLKCAVEPSSVITDAPVQVETLPGLFSVKRSDITVRELAPDLREVRVANKSIEEIQRLLRRSAGPARVSIERNYRLKTTAWIPSDMGLSQQWGLINKGANPQGLKNADVAAANAWELSSGAGVTIAILDTGMDVSHPDLKANTWTADRDFSYSYDGETITCQQGSVGFNAITGKCSKPGDDGLKDGTDHGTHVAGIAAAGANNLQSGVAGGGIVGVSFKAQLLPVKMFDAQGDGSVASAIAALEFVLQVKEQLGTAVRVVSASWGYSASGGECVSLALRNQIERVTDAGILFVTAAGNDGDDIDAPKSRFYPASFNLPRMLTVSASDASDRRWGNYGLQSVHIAAPGIGIYSTIPGPSYVSLSGTSMAVPFVSGAAALVWSYCPAIGVDDVRNAILASADRIPGMFGQVATGGRLNAFGALRRAEHDLVGSHCAVSQ